MKEIRVFLETLFKSNFYNTISICVKNDGKLVTSILIKENILTNKEANDSVPKRVLLFKKMLTLNIIYHNQIKIPKINKAKAIIWFL